MSRPRIGALFAGYGGLDMAVQSVYGGELAWYSEIDKGALKVLNHRFPDVPNVGDVTTADWSQVEPIDILTGGSPCQDLSHAGRRAGMTEGTRSNLWVAMREAIAQLRPSLVVWENVRGAYSAGADSALEFCPGCMGDPWYRGTTLRALGRVLGDLSDLGYDASWHGLRAADVGAPHGRFRVFIVAADTASDARRVAHRDGAPSAFAADLGHERAGRARDGRPGPTDRNASIRRPAGRTADAMPPLRSGDGDEPAIADRSQQLLPTPRATDGTKGGPGQRGSSGDLMLPSAVALLPTPAVNDMGEGKTVERWDGWTADMQAKHGNGNGHGKSLAIKAQRLLPTPRTQNNENRGSESFDPHGTKNFHALLHGAAQWGDYAPAIARWESLSGRPAPEPTQPSKKGTPQLSARFVEWMMGLPAGWVTDVPGITRNEALKALGNGVVPQQAAEALRVMASWEVAA